MEALEFEKEGDPHFDFCMWPFDPVTDVAGKLRSATLLFQSFAAEGVEESALPFVQALRRGIGPFRSVWGVKRFGDRTSWEFYFYDYRRRERDLSAKRVLQAVSPMVNCALEVNEKLAYFMFSIDIDGDLLDGSGNLDEIHLYIGNPGSRVSSGICYSLTRWSMRLENFYFFFDTRKETEDILAKAVCSAHFDASSAGIEEILWPEMRDCRVTVVANKQESDAVYFSGIRVEQLLFFLNKMRYPPATISFVEENRRRLDHLLYDVGFDYRMENGRVVVPKSAYYGCF